MSAVVEIGFNAAPVFSGVDAMERRIRRADDSVAVSQKKLEAALKNPWVSAGVDQRKYFEQLVATERQTRQIAANFAKLSSYKGPQSAAAAVNPWATAGAGQYAAQQAAQQAAADLAAQRRAGDAASAAAYAAQMQRAAAAQQAGARAMQQQAAAAQQAATAQARAGNVMARGGNGRMNLGMAAMQAQDIAVQMQMGTRYSTIIAQQGSQLLSIFGPGGMILGGLVAIGGALYTARQAGREAFQALKEEAEGFDASLRRASAGGVGGMTDAITAMAARAEKLRAEVASAQTSYFGPLARFFSTTTYDEAGKGTNERDAEIAMKAELAAKNEAARVKLIEQVVRLSQEETRIAALRLEGREREAEALERQLKLVRERQRIEDMDLPPAAKEALKNELSRRAGAESRADSAQAAEEAFAKTERLIALQKSLDDMRIAAGREQMTLGQRIAALQTDLNRLAEEERAVRGDFAPDAERLINIEIRRFEIQKQIVESQKQLNEQKRREVDQAKAARFNFLDQIKQIEAEKAARAQSIQDVTKEIALLEAKAAGRDKHAAALQREMDIAARARQIQQQTGADATQAMSIATRMQDLQDKAAARDGGGGGRRKIRGYSQGQEWRGARLSAAAWYGAREGRQGFGSLDDYHRMQKEPGAWGRLQAGNSDWQKTQYGIPQSQLGLAGRSPWLKEQHNANAASQDAAKQGGKVEDYLARLLETTIKGFFGS